MSSLKNYLRSKQRFELELNGVRTIVMSSKIFEALENGTVDLDEERKAAMVSNLLVVLCGNHDAQPVVNSGSLY